MNMSLPCYDIYLLDDGMYKWINNHNCTWFCTGFYSIFLHVYKITCISLCYFRLDCFVVYMFVF